ncbi:MAG: ribosome-associated translation inhibitor RaiA [Atopobiaceae bacterium]|jgi:putative sigma-54 modulation protein|nr:ribosome-associated translation inhibitor RaiA [Atopobiaceae bacterium]MCH4214763.1 ribosome-associated translation inhibitor RaiA [Atopobiaceae bacterium]MCH4229989.1 ribosome-associated translation inhibitor RaiA [Atopobiaceae bacterium]MCH4276928.1 ribosome-associated translation inhibitor RaiA [Atopobiaceae bacterium]MCI1225987.1 ribosome-associated translation inhibitor RaiA [Atopobiaceae bacterium]
MVDIKVSGRKTTVTEPLREYVDEKIGDALKVFEMRPMSCDVVLRVENNPSNPDRSTCEVTVFVRDAVVRVVATDPDMYAAIDIAADKVTRQLRKFKTRVVERKHRSEGLPPQPLTTTDYADLIDEKPGDEDELVREKVIDLPPMTEEQALVQTDLIGHDFYVFTNAETGLVNVIYHRHNGGYGIIKPKIEESDE